jgi:hypothetical protein
MPARIALVVGIGHYDHHHSLELCPPSAEEVFELLISPKYGMCDRDRSVLKTVREGESLTSPDLYREIRQVIKSLQVGDQFLFFFSGHAEVHYDKLFLTTTDAEKPQQGYRFSDLIDSLHDNDIDKAILIIDACHSGAMFDSIKNLQSSEWCPHDLPKGFGFMAAGSRYDHARQVQELGRTLFSYYFCEGLKKGIETEGQYITLPALRKYINSQIKKNFRGRTQRVHTWVREGDADVWLSVNVTPSISPVIDKGEGGFHPSALAHKWIMAIILFLVLVLSVTAFVVYSRFYQPYVSIQATNQAMRATVDALASTSTAAAIQVENNPFDQNAIRTATASARELAQAEATGTVVIAAIPSHTPTHTTVPPTATLSRTPTLTATWALPPTQVHSATPTSAIPARTLQPTPTSAPIDTPLSTLPSTTSPFSLLVDAGEALLFNDVEIGTNDGKTIYVTLAAPNVSQQTEQYANMWGLYRSNDYGVTWHHLGTEYQGYIHSPQVDDGTVIVRSVRYSHYVRFREDLDSGQQLPFLVGCYARSILSMSRGPYTMGGGLVISPGNPNQIFCQTKDENLFSDDGGLTWKKLNDPPVLPNPVNAFSAIAFDTSNPQTIYAGVAPARDTREFTVGQQGLYRSQDGGQNWELATGTGGRIEKIIVGPNKSLWFLETMWTLGYGNNLANHLYVSRDAGETWSLIMQGPIPPESLAISFEPNETIYIWLEHKLHKSTDGGVTWADLESPLNGSSQPIRTIRVARSNANIVLLSDYCSTCGKTSEVQQERVFISQDGGITWRQL